MSRIGKIDIYEQSSESWTCYQERLDQYFVANEVANDKKVPALLSLIGPKTYGVLRDLTSPNLPKEKTYEQLCELLSKHFNPEPLVIAERFRFHKRDQKQGESVTDFNVSLRKLSEHCKFGQSLNDTLRDRLVCGLLNENIQKRLLSEKDLTYEKALEISLSMESAQKDVKELHGVAVNKMSVSKKKVKKTDQKASSGAKLTCYRCNRNNHIASECRFIKSKCNTCGKIGHIATACRSRNKQSGKPRAIHNLDGCSEEEQEDDQFLFNLTDLYSSTQNTKSRKPITVCPKVQEIDLEMELDTGAGVSVISEAEYKQLLPKMKLEDTNLRLQTYSGEKIEPKGKIQCNVKLNGQSRMLDLYVVEGSGKALFGREWLHELKLDWTQIKAMKVENNEQYIKTQVNTIIKKHEEVFRKELGHIKGVQAKLNLKEGTTPKFVKARSVPFSMKPAIEKELDKLVEQGVITPVEFSEWATPIVPVQKANGSVRICGDFKVTVNPNLNTAQYPLPKIDDIFANLENGGRYTKIDLKDAYLQLEVDEQSQELLTISTHKGLFRYKRLCFGISSAPAIFQRTIEQIISGIPGVQVILDDLVITGKTDQDHLNHLEAVLQQFEKYGVKLNEEKCLFFSRKISFCGHVIDEEGLHKSQEKIDAIKNAPKIENVGQLRAFLGLVQYYGKFLKNLAMVLHPLHELLKKDTPWKWTSKCSGAVETVKTMITSDLVLTHYNPELPLVLACDASSYGIGCVLSHVFPTGEERPVAFASRSLNVAEKKYSQVDKEALSIIWGVKKFQQYLAMRHFTLITDNRPLLTILNPAKGINATTAARLQRYALFLSGFDYDIKYKDTKSHGNCDSLSRLPLPEDKSEINQKDETDLLFTSVLETLPVTSSQIATATKRDPLLSQVFEVVSKGSKLQTENKDLEPYMRRLNELSLHQDCIMWGIRVVIPSKLQQTILNELHEGHMGLVKMKSLARRNVWWPTVDRDLEHVVKSCTGCMETKSAPPESPIHPWEIPACPWSRVHVDFAGPVDGYMMFVAVDAYSKWPIVKLMKSTTANMTVEVLRSIFSDCGIPDMIVSDNGPQFKSEEFSNFLQKNGVKHVTSAPYHPKSNGLAERFVQSVKQSIKASKHDEGSLQTKISRFLMQYRNTEHPTTKETPAQLFFGRKLMTKLDKCKPSVAKSYRSAQSKMVRSTQDRNFEQGQLVSVRDYRTHGRNWIPGTIYRKTGPVSYEVEIAPGIKWNRHCDQMRESEVFEKKPDFDQREYSSKNITSENIPRVSEPSVSSKIPVVKDVPIVSQKSSEIKQPVQVDTRPKRNVKAPTRLITEM